MQGDVHTERHANLTTDVQYAINMDMVDTSVERRMEEVEDQVSQMDMVTIMMDTEAVVQEKTGMTILTTIIMVKDPMIRIGMRINETIKIIILSDKVTLIRNFLVNSQICDRKTTVITIVWVKLMNRIKLLNNKINSNNQFVSF